MDASSQALRDQLMRALDWGEAHVSFDDAVEDIPADKRGALAAGFEHSLWQLVEHLRLAQTDLLDFSVNPQYAHAAVFPDDYWPRSPAPPDSAAWDASIAAFKADRERLKALVRDPAVDLLATVPTGTAGQTHLRTILLVIDHNAYHVGQLLDVRRALGIWK